MEELGGTLIRGSEAARRLSLCREQAVRLAKAGQVRAVKTPLGMLFDPEDVERLRQQRAHAAARHG